FRHSPEWRQFSFRAVWEATRQARGWYIAGSLVLIYASYLIRTWRWQGLMAPRGRFWPVFKGTVVGFTSTALLGRPGELVRPYYIGRKHNGDLSSQLAVWLLERVFDMAGVVLLVGLDLGLDPRIHDLTRTSYYQSAFRHAGMVLSIGIVVILVLLYVFHLRSSGILERLGSKNALRPSKVRLKLQSFLKMLAQGTGGLTRFGTLLATIVYTLLL